MLDYASLSAIAAIVREGSFERAARTLNVTPSAISQRVKQLEERLGSVLIIRGQPCKATETGKLICRHVEQVGMLEQELRGVLPHLSSGEQSNDTPTIRIAVNADSLGTWFVQAMAKFLESNHVLMDVVLDDQDHTHEWLKSGDVLAVVSSDSAPVQGCDSIALGKLQYRAVASPEYVRRYFGEGVNAATLAKAPSLRFDRKDQLQARWIKSVCRRDVDVPTHWTPSTQAFIDAAAAGIGWGMNPATLVAARLENGSLVELVPGKTLSTPLYWQHTRLQVPMLAKLTQAVIDASQLALD